MNIAILTSGGDAPGMNAAIRSIVRSAESLGYRVYGALDGYNGLVENRFKELSHKDVSGLLYLGGTCLGTSRLPEFKDEKIRKKAIANLEDLEIDALIVIGGDGTYRGAHLLSEAGIKTIGIPGTIDNDVVGTEVTIGFNTALTTIVDAIDKLRDTSTSHRRCSIVEVMGRKNGDLALYAGLCCGAEFIITPENLVEKEAIFKGMRKYKTQGRKHAIIIVTENLFDVHQLASEITEKSGFTSRATVLGYIQRGGHPVPQDRVLASKMGNYAVELLSKGIHGVCVGLQNNQLINTDFNQVVSSLKPKDELYKLAKRIN